MPASSTATEAGEAAGGAGFNDAEPCRHLLAAGASAERLAADGLAADRLKVLHFMRHAQSIGNVAGAQFPKGSAARKQVYQDERYFDAPLSEEGLAQCQRLAGTDGALPEAQLILASPLTRALQTATIAFSLGATVNVAGPSLVVLEELREFNSSKPHPCDWRQPRESLEPVFPHADFSEMVNGPDSILGPGLVETAPHCDGRIDRLLTWLRKRPERSIACVSHYGFLKRLFYKHFEPVGWRPPEGNGQWGNVEMRSVVVAFQ